MIFQSDQLYISPNLIFHTFTWCLLSAKFHKLSTHWQILLFLENLSHKAMFVFIEEHGRSSWLMILMSRCITRSKLPNWKSEAQTLGVWPIWERLKTRESEDLKQDLEWWCEALPRERDENKIFKKKLYKIFQFRIPP
mgnify:CR=1 FL=1